MEFSSFLQEIGAATRLDTSAATDAGGCTIVFSETMEVTFEHDARTRMVQVFAPVIAVGQWPTELRARMLASVLQLHLFGMGTDGSYFGFDPESERIVFFRSIALAELTPAQAVQAVESFVNQLDRWQAHLVRAATAPGDAANQAAQSRELPMQRA
ncbi:type III secretion system chaperone [Pantoea sp. 18069]|uniref:type III secretion system chaperone n=1 Tax=Pantoea sp. 18069 TaxID=2681415 RepID=UPI001357945F|nr:type III secretion system chaperone [Pantoea sp. 18069]